MPAALYPILKSLAPMLVQAALKKSALPPEMEAELMAATNRISDDDLGDAMQEMRDVMQRSDEQQLSLNKLDAVSTRFWQAGRRPFIGWVCGMAFCWHFLLSPITQMIASSFGVEVMMPSFEMETLNTTLFGLLGLGAMRSFEKVKLR